MSFLDVPALGWLALAVVSAIVEVSIPHFGLAFAAVGAVVAAVAAAFGWSLSVQIVFFVVGLVVSLLVLRPRLLRTMGAPGVPSRTAQLSGKEGLVTQDIDPMLGGGRITVNGEDWAAHSGEAISAGTRIRVVGADGIVLEVRRS